MIFYETNIYKKLEGIDAAISFALGMTERILINQNLGRDVQVLKVCDLPSKPKLSTPEGQARLIHDLANIELQAMELALRSLYEFIDAPETFRFELAQLAKAESEHLIRCLESLTSLGYKWGDWPIHSALWQTVSPTDSLLERVFIVHRYLEASGLDAGESILIRLSGVSDKRIQKTVQHIVQEEVSHVEFGTRWFRIFCQEQGLNADEEFERQFKKMALLSPRKERLSENLRRRAGFNESEMRFLKSI
jgi:uncharacterized ferritin-like protein (DUF455 family)